MVDPIGIGSSNLNALTNKASDSSASSTENQQTVDKDLFLKLMVAQLKNQNPLNPVDGVDFLMQLSQISSVEQMVEMRRELEGIHAILGANAATAATTADNSN
jgi:flagellar basal-body rod modification protein FlgD